MKHELKTDPEPFRAMLLGLKQYEVRRSDRPFNVADTLVLQEYRRDVGDYTGREIEAQITYITPAGAYGLPDDLCVLGVHINRVMES